MSETILRMRARSSALIGAVLLAAFFMVVPAAAQAPKVDWRRSDWFPLSPYPTPLFTSYQPQEKSGEDWWDNHANSYDVNTHALQGYIAAGFSSFPNYTPNEPTGCLRDQVDTTPSCNEFETPGHINGRPLATLALIDPSGSSYLWFKAYNHGEFFRVIQTSDGGYLATGYTASTLNLDQTKPLYYNPGQTPGHAMDRGVGHGSCGIGRFFFCGIYPDVVIR